MATILIVEDRQPDRQFLASLLGYKGHTVVEARDGAEALVLLRMWRPNLVISDLLMPTMDGYEFVRRARENAELGRIPVIFYTATYHEEHARALALRCGAFDVLIKPSEPQAILSAVGAALASSLRPAGGAPIGAEFDREHARVVSDKLAQKVTALEATEQRFAALVDVGCELASTHDPMLVMQHVCGAARDITLANHALLGILNADGSAVETLLTAGLDATIAKPLTVPSADIELLREIIQQRKSQRRLNRGGLPGSLGLPADHPAVFSLLGVPVASSSHVYGWLSVRNKLGADEFTDADERAAVALGALAGVAYENAHLIDRMRRSEERTQFALSAARMGVFEVDIASLRLEWSKTLSAIFDFTPETTPQDMGAFLTLVHPDDRGLVQDAFDRLVEGGIEYQGEFRLRRPDGSVRWVLGRGRMIRDMQGSRLIAVGVDISERKSLEATVAGQRLRVLKATMRSVEDIVVNCFNGLQLFRMEAEGVLPAASLALFDHVVSEGTTRLRALGNLESTPEKVMGIGIAIDYESQPPNGT